MKNLELLQDREYSSDFDKMVEGVKKGEIPPPPKPSPIPDPPLSDFNKKLITGLEYDPKKETSGLSLKSIKKRKDHRKGKDEK